MKENVAPNHDGKSAPYGSGYKRLKKAIDESLRDWFKKKIGSVSILQVIYLVSVVQ